MSRIQTDIEEERDRQRAKWGEQYHSFDHWYVILGEEFGEVGRAIFEGNTSNLREELIQVAAVCVAALEQLDSA